MSAVEVSGQVAVVDFDIVPLTAANPPTIVEPSGKPVTIVLATTSSDSFKMDGAFDIGDVVEIYKVAGTGSVQILDENNNDISPANANDAGEGTRYRKIATGSAPTWGRVS